MRSLLILVVLVVLAVMASAAVHPRLQELSEYEYDYEYENENEEPSSLVEAEAEAEAEIEGESDIAAEADAEAEALVAQETEAGAESEEEADMQQLAAAQAEAEAEEAAEAEAEEEQSSSFDFENSMLESEQLPKGAPKSWLPGDAIAVMPPTWPPVFNPPLLSYPPGGVPRNALKWARAHKKVEYPPSELQYGNFEVDKAALDIIDDPVTVKNREDREENVRWEKLVDSSEHLLKRSDRLAEGNNAVKTPIIYYIRQDPTLTVP